MLSMNHISDDGIRNVLDTMGCTRDDGGKQIIGDQVRSLELRAFLKRAITQFQDRSQSQNEFFKEDIINMVIGLVGLCRDDETLEESELKRYGDMFVYLCSFAPEGTGTSPEGDRTPVVEGSCRLIEAR